MCVCVCVCVCVNRKLQVAEGKESTLARNLTAGALVIRANKDFRGVINC